METLYHFFYFMLGDFRISDFQAKTVVVSIDEAGNLECIL